MAWDVFPRRGFLSRDLKGEKEAAVRRASPAQRKRAVLKPGEKSTWLASGNQRPGCLRQGIGEPLCRTGFDVQCLENPMNGEVWWAAVHGVAKSQTQLSDFPFTFHFHALEKEMATHSSVLAWRIPGTGEPGGLLSMWSHRVRHDWSDLAAAAKTWARGCLASQKACCLEKELLAGAGPGIPREKFCIFILSRDCRQCHQGWVGAVETEKSV